MESNLYGGILGSDIKDVETKINGILENSDCYSLQHNYEDISFQGISQNGIETFKTEINALISKVQGEINSINSNMFDTAFSGPLRDASTALINSIKLLLQNLIAELDIYIKKADYVYQTMSTGTEQIKSQVTTKADEIRTQAGNIDIG